jgi:histidinol-phosphatase
MAYDIELRTALALMEDAGQLALRYRAEGIQAEDKPDDSPVTIADRECEKLFVATLDRAFPGDGLLGEEGASKDSRNGRRWIIDPIDGTRDYVRNIPTWCSLLALEVEGRVVLGVAAFPKLGETYWAVSGQGAHRNGERIRISTITEVGRSVGCINQIQNVKERPGTDKIIDLMAGFWAVRCFGGALDAMLVCSGCAEFWLEPYAKPWDLAVVQVMAQESGAAFFDYRGENTIYGSNAILCVPALVPTARWFLGLDPAATP